MRSRIIAIILMLICLLGSFILQTNAAEANWLWPVPASTSISQYYGNHDGLDITAGSNVAIVASKSGTVVRRYTGCNNTNGYYSSCTSKGTCSPNSGYWAATGTCNNGYGNGIVIDHGDGTYSHYAHMSTTSVSNGAYVSQGQQIGTMGSTGYSTGRHLHFSLATSPSGSGGRFNNNTSAISYIYSVSTQNASVTLDKSSWRYSIGKTNAVVCGIINNPNRGTISTVGCYLYDQSGKLLHTHSEPCNPSYVNGATVQLWTDFNNEAHYTLKVGTTYKYVMYAYIDGQIYKSSMDSFTTAGKTTTKKATTTTKAVTKTNAIPSIAEPTFPTLATVHKTNNITTAKTTVKTNSVVANVSTTKPSASGTATTKSSSIQSSQTNKTTKSAQKATTAINFSTQSASESVNDNLIQEVQHSTTDVKEDNQSADAALNTKEDNLHRTIFVIIIVILCAIILVASVLLVIVLFRKNRISDVIQIVRLNNLLRLCVGVIVVASVLLFSVIFYALNKNDAGVEKPHTTANAAATIETTTGEKDNCTNIESTHNNTEHTSTIEKTDEKFTVAKTTIKPTSVENTTKPTTVKTTANIGYSIDDLSRAILAYTRYEYRGSVCDLGRRVEPGEDIWDCVDPDIKLVVEVLEVKCCKNIDDAKSHIQQYLSDNIFDYRWFDEYYFEYKGHLYYIDGARGSVGYKTKITEDDITRTAYNKISIITKQYYSGGTFSNYAKFDFEYQDGAYKIEKVTALE